MTKSTGTPYKVLKQMGGAGGWPEIKKKIEVYLPITTKVHAPNNLHRKQQSDKTL